MKIKHNNQIEQLLQRYKAGETSLTEEKHLAELLAQPKHKGQYPDEAVLFDYFNDAKTEHKAPSFVQQFVVQQELKAKNKAHDTPNWKIAMRYAAVLILALSATFFTAQHSHNKQKEEARIAYVATKKALFLISKEMNNATQQLYTIEKATQKTQNFINY